jgi:hypothetical protein
VEAAEPASLPELETGRLSVVAPGVESLTEEALAEPALRAPGPEAPPGYEKAS